VNLFAAHKQKLAAAAAPVARSVAVGAGEVHLWREGGLGDLVFLEPALRRLPQAILHTLFASEVAAMLARRVEPGAAADRPAGGVDLENLLELHPRAHDWDRVSLWEDILGLSMGSEAPRVVLPGGGHEFVAGHPRFDGAKPVLCFSPASGFGARTAFRGIPWSILPNLIAGLAEKYNVVMATPFPQSRPEFAGALTFENVELLQYMQIVGSCDVFLGMDSGGSHLASAAGIPTVAIYEHVPPWLRMWRLPHQHALYMRRADCSCTFHESCPAVGDLGPDRYEEPCKAHLTAEMLLPVLADAQAGTAERLYGPDALPRDMAVLRARSQEVVVDDTRLARIAQEARRTASLACGTALEVGTYRGGTARCIATAAPNMPLLTVDTFAGIPGEDVRAGDGHPAGDFAASYAEVSDRLRDCPNVTVRQGRYPEALTAQEAAQPLAFAHYDGDTGPGCEEFLRRCWPLLLPGGTLVIDDVGNPNCPGVTAAADAFWLGPVERHEWQAIIRRGRA